MALTYAIYYQALLFPLQVYNCLGMGIMCFFPHWYLENYRALRFPGLITQVYDEALIIHDTRQCHDYKCNCFVQPCSLYIQLFGGN